MPNNVDQRLIAMGNIDAITSIIPQYKDYIAATNGVVRLDKDTPSKYKGLSTSGLRPCFGIILESGDKVSLIHHYSGKTDYDSYKNEIEWLGDPANIKVTIASNEKFIHNSPTHIYNIMNDFASLCNKLSELGINSSNLNRVDASEGAIYYDRETKEVKSYDNALQETEFVGTPYPYTALRISRNDLSGHRFEGDKYKISLDLQFNGKHWTKMEKPQRMLFNEEDISFIKNNFRDEKAIDTYIRNLPAFKEFREKHPNGYLSEAEIKNGIKTQSHFAINYDASRDFYEKNSPTYKCFTLNRRQKNLISELGGEVLSEKDRGMFQFKMPSRLLNADIRDDLKVDRVRLTSREVNKMPQYLHSQLCDKVKGWRGETDFTKANSVLITFPYIDNEDKANKRKVIELANSLSDKMSAGIRR